MRQASSNKQEQTASSKNRRSAIREQQAACSNQQPATGMQRHAAACSMQHAAARSRQKAANSRKQAAAAAAGSESSFTAYLGISASMAMALRRRRSQFNGFHLCPFITPEGKAKLTLTTERNFRDWDHFATENLDFMKNHASFNAPLLEAYRNQLLHAQSQLPAHQSDGSMVFEQEDFIRRCQDRQARVVSTAESMSNVIQKLGWSVGMGLLAGLAGAAGAGAVTSFFSGPVGWVALAGGVATGGAVAAYVGRDLFTLYRNRDIVEVVKDKLCEFEQDFQLLHRMAPRPLGQMNDLFRESVTVLADALFEDFKEATDLRLPKNPRCYCGETFGTKKTSNCYAGDYGHVICDACDKQVNDAYVFHCPKRYTDKHPKGYDVCFECAKRYRDNIRGYHVLILQPHCVATDGCQDAHGLEHVFLEHYHTTKVLTGSECTITNTRKWVKRLAHYKTNDTIVICYTGHGKKVGNAFMMYLDQNVPYTHAMLMEDLLSTDSSTTSPAASATEMFNTRDIVRTMPRPE